MSITPTSIQPMDAEGKRLRRERVEGLAQLVRSHQEAGTWSHPDADLALSELEWEVGGMSRYIRQLLTEIFSETDGSNIHQTMIDGTLEEEHVEAVLILLAQHNMRLLAERTIALAGLVRSARQQLDAVITAPRAAGDQNEMQRAIAAIVDAEHAGDLREAKRLAMELAASEVENRDAQASLGRARRDQARLVALQLIEPPYRNLRQRVLEAIRGPQTQPAV